MKVFYTVMLVLLIAACGYSPNYEPTPTATSSPSAEEESSGSHLAEGAFYFEGYISPIGVAVNDKYYKDSEDFYTQELDRLKKDAAIKYPDYRLHFDADVGLRSFKNGFTVFLVSAGENGVASEAEVDGTGRFLFQLPPNIDKQELYHIRATKRIEIKLVKGDDIITFCHNLSGDSTVMLTDTPVLLRKLYTQMTAYECVDNSSQLSLPDRAILKQKNDQQLPDDELASVFVVSQ